MRYELPADWVAVELNEVATIGPKTDVRDLPDAQLVHFVPMAAVAEDFGGVDTAQLRPLSEVRKGYTSFADGDVLFAKITPCMENGKGGVVPTLPQRFAFGSTEFHVIRPSEAVTASWLAHFLSQPLFRRIARQNMTGSAGQLRVPTKWLASVSTPVPPLAEQTRIVAKLEELLSDLDAGVAELKAAQAKLAQYRQSLLKAAVEGALTADWRARRAARETDRPAQPGDAENRPRPAEFHASFATGQKRRHETPPTGGCAVQADSADGLESGAQLLARILTERRARWEARQLTRLQSQGKTPPKGWQSKYPEPVAPDTRDLPELPEGWVWASLDMLGEIASGVAKGSKLKAGLSVREVPYLRVANVQRGYLDLSEIKTIEATESDIEELALKNGDVLFNEGGDRDKLGRGWVWRDEIPECIYQNHVFRMRPWLNAINSEFISHHGNSFGKRWFQRAGKQTTNLASINLSILRAFPVPVPPPAEQEAIITQLSEQLAALEIQVAEVERSIKQSAAQRQNLLKAAFSGQLVPQDPNDEPASELLERISSRRHAAKKPTRTTGSRSTPRRTAPC